MHKNWHSMPASQVAELLKTDPQLGLTRKEVSRRLLSSGPNRLERKKRPGALAIFLSQFKDPTVLTLLVATAVSAAMKEVVDAAVIAAIVAMNAVLGAVQEHKAETSLEALENYAPPGAGVIRDGRPLAISREEVVPGDLILLNPGTRVPADARIVSSKALSVDEATLTGESRPVSKEPSAALAAKTTISDRKTMVYGGTLVTRGEGTAIVVATGMDTEMGAIAEMVGAATPQPTPLQIRLESLGKIILVTCLGICGALTAIGFLRGLPFQDVFLTGVSLAVAAVPEGLPAVVTVAFAFGVQRMARQGAVIRKLEAIETLGSITVICTDKTGTLTKNLMEVAEVASPEDVIVRPSFPKDTRISSDILRIALLASDARHAPGGTESAGEDPTEQAIVAAAMGAGVHVRGLDESNPRLSEIPFSPERRMMSVKVAYEEGALVCAKGATDVILPACSTQILGGRIAPFGQKERAAWSAWIEGQAGRGMRVLAVAQRRDGAPSLNGEGYKEEDLTFRGCLSMADPLRPEAAPAVERCRRAGIRPVLMTGDHLLTAESVAKEAGILSRTEKAMTGAELEARGRSGARDAVANCSAFARVSPANKLQIVRSLKELGHVVAMTGDGVNDAPALREAAVGVSMGLSGTDVARGASSMVLLDDNFSTIVKAIEEGRSIYDNIRKFIRYLFSCNIGEVMTMLVAAVLGLPMPLTAAELLWMNLVTDGLPALALSRDPPDPDIMNRRPRDPKEGLFAGGLWRKILVRGLYIGTATLLVFISNLTTSGPAVASTMAYATLVTVQLVAALDCRSEEKHLAEMPLFSNPILVFSCVLSFLMLFATIQYPPVSAFFRTVPLTLSQWGVVFLCSIFPDLFGIAFSRKKR